METAVRNKVSEVSTWKELIDEFGFTPYTEETESPDLFVYRDGYKENRWHIFKARSKEFDSFIGSFIKDYGFEYFLKKSCSLFSKGMPLDWGFLKLEYVLYDKDGYFTAVDGDFKQLELCKMDVADWISEREEDESA